VCSVIDIFLELLKQILNVFVILLVNM